MADKPMHHYSMEDNVNGSSGGQFVVTVGSDGKLMQVRDPLFMPTSSGVPTLAGGKREEMNPNINVSYRILLVSCACWKRCGEITCSFFSFCAAGII